jgi:hypothetical protein
MDVPHLCPHIRLKGGERHSNRKRFLSIESELLQKKPLVKDTADMALERRNRPKSLQPCHIHAHATTGAGQTTPAKLRRFKPNFSSLILWALHHPQR